MQIISLDQLFNAWHEFKIGKQKRNDVMEFERHLEDNLFLLHDELNTKTYRHQPYYTFHVHDPKFRIINKATVRDRIVHHVLFSYLEPLYEPTFIHHAYSCRKGKGVHVAVNDAEAALRKISKNCTRTVWSLKLDIQKFFASVNHDILFGLLQKKIHDANMLDLIGSIIKSFSTPGCYGKGMPIGNLTSQIFANVYLSELDYFAKHTLHEPYYFRYADDFLFLHTDRTHLLAIQKTVEIFVRDSLNLTVHPKKIIMRPYHHGIDWLGYILLPHYRTIRTKTKQRVFRKIRKLKDDMETGKVSEETFDQTVQSYLGVLSHCHSYRLRQKLMNGIWMDIL